MSSMSPTFSVVIPTYNRPVGLRECLCGLAALEYPRERYEVIVVNDGGMDLAPFAKDFPQELDLTLLWRTNGGSGAARNLGVTHAQAKWIAFIDDDCIPSADWLARIEARLQANPNSVVGGDVLNGLPDNPYAEATQVMMKQLYTYYHTGERLCSQHPYFATNNFAIPKRIFQDVGGFYEPMRLGEDRDLSARLGLAGVPLVYAPEALVYHYRENNARAFWRQHAIYGYGAYRYHQRRVARGANDFRVEPLRFYKELFTCPWRSASGWQAARLSFLIVLAQFANIQGFASATLDAVRKRPKQ